MDCIQGTINNKTFILIDTKTNQEVSFKSIIPKLGIERIGNEYFTKTKYTRVIEIKNNIVKGKLNFIHAKGYVVKMVAKKYITYSKEYKYKININLSKNKWRPLKVNKHYVMWFSGNDSIIDCSKDRQKRLESFKEPISLKEFKSNINFYVKQYKNNTKKFYGVIN